MARLILYIWLLNIPCLTWAQGYFLQVLAAGGEDLPRHYRRSMEVADSLGNFRLLKGMVQELREDGYLAASVDSVVFDSMHVSAYLFMGPRFKWGKISFDSIDSKILHKAGIRARSFSGKPVKAGKLASAQEKLIRFHENSGYPFASTYLTQISMDGPILSGNLHVMDHGQFRIDTIHIKGEARIARSYLEKLTSIEPGDVYREDRIRNISNRIRETTFLEEIRPFELAYYKGKVDVYTYLKKARASQTTK